MVVFEAIKGIISLQGLLDELGVHCDSQSALHLAKNQVHHARKKHIDVKCNFISVILEDDRVSI